MNSIGILSVFGVFWEDTIFTLPTLIMDKIGADKLTRFISLAVSSLVFASGHLSYGIEWASITLLYVPLISYPVSRKYGLGTAIACHIIYDLATILTFKMLG